MLIFSTSAAHARPGIRTCPLKRSPSVCAWRLSNAFGDCGGQLGVFHYHRSVHEDALHDINHQAEKLGFRGVYEGSAEAHLDVVDSSEPHYGPTDGVHEGERKHLPEGLRHLADGELPRVVRDFLQDRGLGDGQADAFACSKVQAFLKDRQVLLGRVHIACHDQVRCPNQGDGAEALLGVVEDDDLAAFQSRFLHRAFPIAPEVIDHAIAVNLPGKTHERARAVGVLPVFGPSTCASVHPANHVQKPPELFTTAIGQNKKRQPCQIGENLHVHDDEERGIGGEPAKGIFLQIAGSLLGVEADAYDRVAAAF